MWLIFCDTDFSATELEDYAASILYETYLSVKIFYNLQGYGEQLKS